MHLVVLDDDLRIANFLGLLARERNWTVSIATNPGDFQRFCIAEEPAAVTLDLFLGNSDGVEQLRFLASIGYRGTVALMSGFDGRVLASAEQVANSLGLSIAATLQKPMRVAQVRQMFDAIERRIEQASLEQVNARNVAAANLISKSISASDVLDAIDDGQMRLHLQPIVNAEGNCVDQLEALIRWQLPGGEMVFPDQFLPIAERDSFVIDRLLRWTLDAAFASHRELINLGSPAAIAVNVSGANLRSLDFPDHIAAHLFAARVPPSAIVLEVTESVAIGSSSLIADVLTRLRLKGFQLAIDDLGTGHSSLSLLRQMPFSEIKIDKSFVHDMFNSRDSLAIVKSMIDLARNMNLRCVAEGVETEETERALLRLGVDRLQGYLYARPLPQEEIAAWLMQWNSKRERSRPMFEQRNNK